MLTFLCCIALLVLVSVVVIRLVGKNKVEAEVKAVERKIVSEVLTVQKKISDELKKL